MRKVGLIALILIIILPASANANHLDHSEVFESDEIEFQQMHTTAYCLHGTTASGGTTRPGIAACNPHLGEMAVIYTLDGEYLTTVEITDCGGHERLQQGTSIDVWFDTLDKCQEWMTQTDNGEIMVQFIAGDG